jgi:broad specificity phosphatase PhoE
MTKHLILVKHSVPEIQQDRPANTWKLSEQGRLRAHRLAEELADFAPEMIVASREPKAKETADIVARHLRLNVQITPDLHEHDRSNVPYLSHDAFQTSIYEFFQRPDQLAFGRETADQAYTRFYQAVHSLLVENKNKTIIMVTHGTVLSLFVARLTGSSALELWNRLGLPSFVAMDLGSSTVIVRDTIV